MENFDYSKAGLEEVSCNLCTKNDFRILAKKSATGLAAQTCICRNCGLIYINPQMTKKDYNEYYKHFYREDRALAKGRAEKNQDLEKNFENARKFGRALAERLGSYFRPGLTVDFGSSTGGVLFGLREVIPQIRTLGVEPSFAESQFANQKGIFTHNSLFENLSEDAVKPASADNIVCVQSLNHLLNPREFFNWCFQHLKSKGHLILSVKNFRHQARRAGSVEAGVQIDHPYMFTPETLTLFVESAGFKVRHLEIDENKTEKELWQQRKSGLTRHHIRLAAEKPAGVQIRPAAVSQPENYRKIFWQLSQPYLKAYYLLIYSRHSAPLRRFLGLVK